MPDRTMTPNPPASLPAWILPAAVLITATCGAAAIGHYAYDVEGQLGIVPLSHVLLGGLLATWMVSAVIELWARPMDPSHATGLNMQEPPAPQEPPTLVEGYSPTNTTATPRAISAALRSPGVGTFAVVLNRVAVVGLLPVLACHVWRAYWATVHGPRPLPVGYRLPLILGLLAAALMLIALVARRLLPRRHANPATAGLASLAISLFVAEVIWSSMYPPFPGPRKLARDGGFITQQIDEDAFGYPYVFRPEAGYREEWGSNPRGHFDDRHGLDYHINELGLRGPVFPKKRTGRAYRVAFLGDSFTFSEGVDEDHTLPQQVARKLQQRCRGVTVECINGGVGGFDTKQEVALYRHRLMCYQPDAVVVVMGLNDRSPSSVNQTRTWRPNKLQRLSAIFARARAAIEPVFVKDLPLVVDSYEACFDALAELRAISSPGQQLWVAIYPYVDLMPNYPYRQLHARLTARLEADGFAVIDLLSALRAVASDGLTVHPHQDAHPNELAHQAAAEAIAGRLGPGLSARLQLAGADDTIEP